MSELSIGNRLLSKNDNAIQSDANRPNTLTSGHRACQGCGEALGARAAIDAAYRVTNGRIAVVNATGCLEVFSCVFPENSWNGIPWIHSLFGNVPSVATGLAAAYRARGQHDMRVIAQGGDGATTDIGLGALSGMFDRNDDVLYICYDNQAYMNTGVQRSSATPYHTRTATTSPIGDYLGNEFGTGKNVPEIAMAHRITYVATASVANIRDLERKVIKAIQKVGAKYIHVHVPCPLGWGHQPADTIKIARLAVESGLFPLFEAEDGVLTDATKIENRKPVEDYMKIQRRFAHLFGKNAPANALEIFQKIADKNIEKYNLIGGLSNG